jgi:hypothetical protein
MEPFEKIAGDLFALAQDVVSAILGAAGGG